MFTPQSGFFCDTVLFAARHNIPAGRRHFLIPALNDETKKLAQQRDSFRILYPSDSHVTDLNKGNMSKTSKIKKKDENSSELSLTRGRLVNSG